MDIPTDYPVQPIEPNDPTAISPATCGHCGLTWDDGKVTSMTPAPSARCPFEPFHEYDDDDETCEWFILCENPATTTAPHPIIGDVPTCDRCYVFATS